MSKMNNNKTEEKKPVSEEKTKPLTDEALDEIAGGNWVDDIKKIVKQQDDVVDIGSLFNK